jgi:hypothetical protein
MFRIRPGFFDDISPVNLEAVRQVQEILRAQFPLLRQSDIRKIPELLLNHLKFLLKSILYVAENYKDRIEEFTFISHEPELKFCFLDYIPAAKAVTGRGIGGALYERVGEEALSLKVSGIFFECLPYDPKLCRDPEILKQNKARLANVGVLLGNQTVRCYVASTTILWS